MITVALLAGIWTTACIQTQIFHLNQGHVKESYTFSQNHEFEFKREWFRDEKCSEPISSDVESGTIEIGPRIGGLFNPGETFEANFSTQSGVDLGAISTKSNQSIKIARGVVNGTFRNTMLSLFEYTKQQ